MRPRPSTILENIGGGYALAKTSNERAALPREVIDLSIGEPRLPPPPVALEALARAARQTGHHDYAPFRGTTRLREAFAAWYQRRYGLALDPGRQVLPLLGAKEGLSHLIMAFAGPGLPVYCGEVSYPIFRGTAKLVGAPVVELPGGWDEAYVPSFPERSSGEGGLVLLPSPSNPTSATIPRPALLGLIEEARRRGLVFCFDAAYAELPGSGEVTVALPQAGDELLVEMHTLSKALCLAGWRVGFAVGSPAIIDGLAQVKSFVDAGIPFPLQQAATEVLEADCDEHIASVRKTFLERQRRLRSVIAGLGLPLLASDAGMYLWTRVPGDGARMTALCAEENLFVMRGSAFGAAGASYVRLHVAVEEDRLPEVRARLARALERL
jgi:LL-diaminopimelate aminotransferase